MFQRCVEKTLKGIECVSAPRWGRWQRLVCEGVEAALWGDWGSAANMTTINALIMGQREKNVQTKKNSVM